MAGAMRKMAVYLGLVEDAGDLDEPYDDIDDRRDDRRDSRRDDRRDDPRTTAMEPVSSGRSGRSSRDESLAESRGGRSIRAVPVPVTATDLYRISTIHPMSYNDARRIGEEFRQGIPVIMNLTEMDDNDAKRIVDFGAGLVFGLHGTIERITNKVFLLSPANVDVAAEARAQVAQGGFFNQS